MAPTTAHQWPTYSSKPSPMLSSCLPKYITMSPKYLASNCFLKEVPLFTNQLKEPSKILKKTKMWTHLSKISNNNTNYRNKVSSTKKPREEGAIQQIIIKKARKTRSANNHDLQPHNLINTSVCLYTINNLH
jgi:hypothetical protein